QRQALVTCEHVPAGRSRVIRPAIELDRFSGRAERGEARRRLQLTANDIAVGIVANLRSEKRHDVFIETARRLAPRYPNLRFLIIGDGPRREAVRAAAAKTGLPAGVLRLLGPRDDVEQLLSGLDVACLCSEVECFSVSMLEAAAAGCAFVGPDTGCLTEFLESGRNGRVIRPADVESLADAIASLVEDSSLRTRLAEAARRDVEEGYGIDTMAGAFADLFSALQAKPRENTVRPMPAPGIRDSQPRNKQPIPVDASPDSYT
ncbi:MAG: glycosyltransferase family 4 protein, partial [Phycisphaerae bacterium]